jgi:hypothetical protein
LILVLLFYDAQKRSDARQAKKPLKIRETKANVIGAPLSHQQAFSLEVVVKEGSSFGFPNDLI